MWYAAVARSGHDGAVGPGAADHHALYGVPQSAVSDTEWRRVNILRKLRHEAQLASGSNLLTLLPNESHTGPKNRN